MASGSDVVVVTISRTCAKELLLALTLALGGGPIKKVTKKNKKGGGKGGGGKSGGKTTAGGKTKVSGSKKGR